MRRTVLFASSTLALSLVPALALAHPGHGSGGHELVHYLSEPLHAYLIAGVPLATGALFALWRRRRSRE